MKLLRVLSAVFRAASQKSPETSRHPQRRHKPRKAIEKLEASASSQSTPEITPKVVNVYTTSSFDHGRQTSTRQSKRELEFSVYAATTQILDLSKPQSAYDLMVAREAQNYMRRLGLPLPYNEIELRQKCIDLGLSREESKIGLKHLTERKGV
jgi:hypothetical protein